MVKGKQLAIVVSLLLIACAAPLRAELDDLEAEERVKKLLVSTLDPALPRESLATWITRVAGPKGKVFWEVNDCGEQTGDPARDEGRDLPACVQASLFVPDGREFGVLISVGTWEKGFLGAPRLRQVYWAEGQQTHTLKRLSQIPAEIKNGPTEDTDDNTTSP
jgi:hypothetical protein